MKILWVVALIIGVAILYFLNRYKVVPTKDDAYLINSFTGDIYFLQDELKIPVEEIRDEEKK